MVFTNATKVMINNKEVQSIKVTSNNGILYQTTIQDSNRRLTLTSNKNTLSYANHDTATLTATLTANNNPIQGENIYIYNNPNNIEFDQMLYGPLYYPCIRLKLEGDGVMTFPGGRGLIINLYNSRTGEI